MKQLFLSYNYASFLLQCKFCNLCINLHQSQKKLTILIIFRICLPTTCFKIMFSWCLFHNETDWVSQVTDSTQTLPHLFVHGNHALYGTTQWSHQYGSLLLGIKNWCSTVFNTEVWKETWSCCFDGLQLNLGDTLNDYFHCNTKCTHIKGVSTLMSMYRKLRYLKCYKLV